MYHKPPLVCVIHDYGRVSHKPRRWCCPPSLPGPPAVLCSPTRPPHEPWRPGPYCTNIHHGLRSCPMTGSGGKPTMYSERQQQILREITRGLGLAEPEPGAVIVEQSPGYVDSVIETADFAVAALGAIGSTVAAIGERRGLG